MKKIFLLSAIFVLLLVWYDQSRSFYYLDKGKSITVWKRLGGVCYIIVGKYYGLIRPADNYIKTNNTNALTILDGKRFGYKYIISNDYGKNISYFFSKEKIKYYDYQNRPSFIKTYYTNGRISSDIKYLMIDIKEDLVVVNGEVK